ncbi:MAG: glycosyltransferase [Prevotellaceae bacterium]|jgi:glycosyltransferase involved in cell wall biosynthesis|nr:glycosyltransferase [Prevotellaceae bacterium]
MKIAYIIYPEAIVINHANGIRNQAIQWADCLKGFCSVDLINPWTEIKWEDYDIVHLFGGNQWLGFVPDLLRKNPNIVFSPILDSIESKFKLKLQAKCGFKGYHHAQNVYKSYIKNFKALLVRSNYEREYFSYCFRVESYKLHIVPISYEFRDIEPVCEKDDFCFHMSTLYQERKNVSRLIQAAKKYNFRLVLAGNTGTKEQHTKILQSIDGYDNIQCLGFISNEYANTLYMKAKVFALPSINEGVGIVALNAGVAGDNIVLTQVGGPKEYFGGYAYLVNPYSIDQIGQAIKTALSDNHSQPNLQQHLTENYSQEVVGKKLFKCYQSILINNQIKYDNF